MLGKERKPIQIQKTNSSTNLLFDPSQMPNRNSNRNACPLIVCLDLDYTIIKSSATPPVLSDFVVEVDDESGVSTQKLFVQKRPYFDKFIKILSTFANIYLFSAAEENYVSQIMDNIDPLRQYFTKIFCRESCVKYEDNKYIKDLSICRSNLSRTVLIDDNPNSFLLQENNGILIRPFNGNYKDNELQKVLKLLSSLSFVNDVRSFLSSKKI